MFSDKENKLFLRWLDDWHKEYYPPLENVCANVGLKEHKWRSPGRLMRKVWWLRMFDWYLRRLPEYKKEGFWAWELHHAWYGLVLMISSFVAVFQAWTTPFWCWVVGLLGLWLFIDDLIQHTLQKIQIKKYGEYDVVTLWHWLPYIIIGRKFEKY